MMSLSMIDVGWGLSELLTTPGGEYILIDAGHTDHLDDVMGFLADHGVGSLKSAVMTHSTYVKQGDTSDSVPGLDWDDTPGFRVQVLSAGVGGTIFEDDDSGTEGMNTNNDSVVLRMTFGNVSFITTGDAEHFTEFGIIDEFGRLGARAQVLQIAHHGSDDSSSEMWLENVSPRVALISCAMVEVALVKEVVLQGCRAVDADYFVTDKAFPNMSRGADPEYGNLITMTDGESIEVMAEHHDW
jgi:competence protein ComEC